jgi:hypothetical protein
MSADVLQTIWISDPWQCVVARGKKCYTLQVLLRGEPFLLESVRTIVEARKRAKALFAVLDGRTYA